ncbi:uncharacterized protein LOC143619464 [Bidens hawaiensis]|uniref:uncharacterized protein LOC143619464 n=1 Tax=Bidens hawaiensis TaxID=980011 RepID=UPI00404B0266
MVYGHLTSPTKPQVISTPKEVDPKAPPPPPTIDSWERIDAIVFIWIYGTITGDLLSTIIKKVTTAYDAWTALAELFNDNKATRVVYLKTKFANTRLDNFQNMHAYCQEHKFLVDQLTNIDALINDNYLVIQLVTGLNEQYEGIGSVIQNTNPLPSFHAARSKVTMEEQKKNHQASFVASVDETALHATTTKSDHSAPTEYRSDSSSERGRGRGRSRDRGQGRNTWVEVVVLDSITTT